MPPALALPARQPQSASYSPVMHVLGRPLQYFLFSKFVFWTTIIGIRMTHNKPDIRTLFQNSSYPNVIGIVSFNLLLSVFLCIYYLLNTLFFGRHPTMTEHTVIVEKLFNFFSFKIVLVGMVIEPDIFGFSVWLAWYAVLASMKAILQYGKLRLNMIVDTNTATVYSYIRPFFHLVFGLFFVATGFYYWKVSLCTAGHFGLSMLVLFDLVTLFIELFQCTVMYVVCILKADAEGNTTSSTSNEENSAERSAEIILIENTSAENNNSNTVLIRKNTKNEVKKILKMMNSLLTGHVAKFSGVLRIWARKLDYADFQSTVDLYSDILILSISLIHYFHVYTINGLSLSLVDIFLFLNIRTTGKI